MTEGLDLIEWLVRLHLGKAILTRILHKQKFFDPFTSNHFIQSITKAHPVT